MLSGGFGKWFEFESGGYVTNGATPSNLIVLHK